MSESFSFLTTFKGSNAFLYRVFSQLLKHVARKLLVLGRVLVVSLKFSAPFVIALIECFAIGYLGYRAGLYVLKSLRYVASLVLAKSNRVTYATELLRAPFLDVEMVVVNPTDNHSHPIAAASRSSGTATIEFFAKSRGFEPYFLQMSRSDQRRGAAGNREWYWGKDVHVEPRADAVPENPLYVAVDVDQYVDMPAVLNELEAPLVLYTFQPHRLSRVAENYSFTFKADDSVDYLVTGGGRFSHHVWNYSGDNLKVTSSFMGIPYACSTYLVDRRHVSDDHELILLTPSGRWGWLMAGLAHVTLQGRLLERLSVVQGDFTRLEVRGKEHVMCTGKPDHFSSACVPITTDNTIHNLANTCKHDITLATVESVVGGDVDTPEAVAARKAQSSVLLDYHRKHAVPRANVVYPVATSVRNYQYGNYDQDAKPSMVPFMSPIVHGAFAPDKTLGNEQTAADKRVTALKSDTQVTPFLARVMAEFVEFLIPVPGILTPLNDDDVYDKQAKPSQRHILDMIGYTAVKRVIKFFVKAEAYGGSKHPRVISTFNGADKAEYSKLIYPLAEVVKKCKWYAFGMKPVEQATRIAEMCSAAKFVDISDFERFDGRVSPAMRALESMVLMRAYPPGEHSALDEVHKAHYGLKAYGKEGATYDQCFARGSGEVGTSLMNTIINGFTHYLAFRTTKRHDGFMSPQESWDSLGLYGGDDGATANLDPKKLEKAAAMVGQKVASVVVQRGELGVKFLARVYGPNVWYGDNNSCCDLPRQLAKFHVTPHLNPGVTSVMKLVEKARCFELTDANTPVLGPYVSSIMRTFGEYAQETPGVTRWQAELPKEVQYPNVDQGWMMYYATTALPEFDFDRWNEYVKDGDDEPIEHFMFPPVCQEMKREEVTETVVVDDEVRVAERPRKLEKKRRSRRRVSN